VTEMASIGYARLVGAGDQITLSIIGHTLKHESEEDEFQLALQFLVDNEARRGAFSRKGNRDDVPWLEESRDFPDQKSIREFNFPDTRSKFPVPLSREFRQKPERRRSFFGFKQAPRRSKSRKFPVFSLIHQGI